MLTVKNLSVSYGAVQAVKGLDLTVAAGEIVALIGANGAGKTSTIRAIAGLLPFAGSVTFEGRALRPNSAERNVGEGLVLVPEGRGILGRMTVLENLQMGLYARSGKPDGAREIQGMFDKFPVLAQRRDLLASFLSGGEQQMLAFARALLAKPRLLLLDEPSLGLAPKMSAFVFQLVAELKANGLTVLMVEQRARQALQVADRAYVLENGRVVLSGAASNLARHGGVTDAFLGKQA